MKQENKEVEGFATDEDIENTKADLLILDPDDETSLAELLSNNEIMDLVWEKQDESESGIVGIR